MTDGDALLYARSHCCWKIKFQRIIFYSTRQLMTKLCRHHISKLAFVSVTDISRKASECASYRLPSSRKLKNSSCELFCAFVTDMLVSYASETNCEVTRRRSRSVGHCQVKATLQTELICIPAVQTHVSRTLKKKKAAILKLSGGGFQIVLVQWLATNRLQHA